jgi:hypothetical protein
MRMPCQNISSCIEDIYGGTFSNWNFLKALGKEVKMKRGVEDAIDLSIC